MNIWLFLFAVLVVAVGWKRAIGAVVTGYAMGLAIGIGLILLLIMIGLAVSPVR